MGYKLIDGKHIGLDMIGDIKKIGCRWNSQPARSAAANRSLLWPSLRQSKTHLCAFGQSRGTRRNFW